ncbi:hypothetical protein [uncultured Amnibacterium sp.]|uniref:hypothetical protein n=1 Tax=uncultured Amnibacterium sp. TaxID=1631851 RepID=UPI0035CB7A31
MPGREATLQQQHPIDSVGFTRLFAIGAAILSSVIAMLTTAAEAEQVANWPLEIGAIVLLCGTGVYFARAASPFRAPFHRQSAVIVMSLTVIAFVLDETAQLGQNRVLHDDWGLVVIPFYLFVIASLRPVRDVVVAGAIASAVVVIVAVVASPFISTQTVPLARALVGVASLVPATLGAAVFARVVMQKLTHDPVADARPVVERSSVRLSVQQENIALLDAGVVPLITDVLAAGSLTAADSRRARQLAKNLRATMVADLSRDWLQEAGLTVDDPQNYADRMTPEQRTTLRGVINAMPLKSRTHPGTVTITGQDFNAVIEMRLPLNRRPSGPRLAPAVVMLRTVFPRAEYRLNGSDLTVVADFHVD